MRCSNLNLVCCRSANAAREEEQPATKVALSSQRVAAVALAVLGAALAGVSFYALFAPSNVIMAKLGVKVCAALAGVGVVGILAAALVACRSSKLASSNELDLEQPEAALASGPQPAADSDEPAFMTKLRRRQPPPHSAPGQQSTDELEAAEKAQSGQLNLVDKPRVELDTKHCTLRFAGQTLQIPIIESGRGGGVVIDVNDKRITYVPKALGEEVVVVAFLGDGCYVDVDNFAEAFARVKIDFQHN